MLAVVWVWLSEAHLAAQVKEEPLRVSTRVVAPFVVQDGDRLSGFSIDLWAEIARGMGAEYALNKRDSVKDLLGAVGSGAADLAIAAISITSEREKLYDFSQPIYEGGLQVLTRVEGDSPSGVAAVLHDLFSPQFLQLLGVALLLILVATHIIWLAERRHPDGIVGGVGYFKGIWRAAWWAASCLATQAEEMPRSAVGRWIAIAWMFGSVVFVAYFTAAVTAQQTVQQLRSGIRGPEDLPGKRVCTVAGSTSETYLKGHRIKAAAFRSVEECFAALIDKRADAVVYDSPVLLYFASHEGRGQVVPAGQVFRHENYGILLSRGSPLRKPVNEALLKLRENGVYEEIHGKWFATN